MDEANVVLECTWRSVPSGDRGALVLVPKALQDLLQFLPKEYRPRQVQMGQKDDERKGKPDFLRGAWENPGCLTTCN